MGVWARRLRVSIVSAASVCALLLVPASASATTIAVNTTADVVSATDGGSAGTRPLTPSQYRLAVTATDAAGNVSAPGIAAFTVAKR